MKNIFRFGFAAIALMFVFSFFAATESKAQGNIPNEILKRMEAHRQSLTSLQASVTMAKFNAQLGETDVTEGTALYLPAKGRDALVRIDWMKPVQETLAVVSGKYVIYRPNLKQAITGNSKEAKGNGKAGNALSFMNMSKSELNANYVVQYLGQENVSGNIPTWHLKMMPKTPTSYQYGEMWVDGNGMPIQMKVTENNNDSTTVLLSNLQKNINIPAKKFKIVLPEGTQIVKG
jgi:outer membrane lipoprotein-sorting protein